MPIHQADGIAVSSVLDFPQLYTKPSPDDLLAILGRLKVKHTAWGEDEGPYREDEVGLPRYLTAIISSSLAWVEDESIREEIWEAASARLSERSGRSAIPSMSRTFIVSTTASDSISITLHEPSLTADNLGHKTWLASFLLANRLPVLAEQLPPLKQCGQTHVIELGAGTGLVGLAIGAMFNVHVHLTDLPAIIPNLCANINSNSTGPTKGSISVGELDWSNVPFRHDDEQNRYDLVVAADPLYSPQHPAWLVGAIGHVLKRDLGARVVIELPLREAYAPQITELQSRMAALGLVIQVEGVESGFEDWEVIHRSTERTKVECWWAIWKWTPTSLSS
ncbi:MAG: hypothetical protein Q9186_003309 [Xanthomendoza sp. 1 TL-2023]